MSVEDNDFTKTDRSAGEHHFLSAQAQGKPLIHVDYFPGNTGTEGEVVLRSMPFSWSRPFQPVSHLLSKPLLRSWAVRLSGM